MASHQSDVRALSRDWVVDLVIIGVDDIGVGFGVFLIFEILYKDQTLIANSV